MKGWAAIFLLSLMSMGLQAQINEEDLIGTWFPVMEQFTQGDTVPVITKSSYVFEMGQIGRAEPLGSNATVYPFRYKLEGDSLFIQTRSDTIRSKIISLGRQNLTIAFDEATRVSFIPLPDYNLSLDISELVDNLVNEVWEFEIQHSAQGKDIKMLYQFGLGSKNRVISPEFRGTIHDIKVMDSDFPQHGGQVFWTVGKHGNSFVLRVDDIFSGFQSGIFIIKHFSENSMELITWRMGKSSKVLARKVKKPSKQKTEHILNLLTRSRWRFDHKVPAPSVDSIQISAISDYFYDRGFSYKVDSTAVILQSDYENGLLMIDFEPDGRYAIYREERLLDSGDWKMSFYGKLVSLKSDRKMSSGDGIFGGELLVESIKKDELRLKAYLIQQVNNSREYSQNTPLEIYSAVKRKK
jgi:hypothetical protein